MTAAGLGPTLSGPGPFTVFAPSDAAFAKLPAGTVDGSIIVIKFNNIIKWLALLKDIPKLTSILTYHVVADSVRPTRNGRTYDTVNGKEISVKVTVDTAESFIWGIINIKYLILLINFMLILYIKGGQDTPAKVVAFDVKADNGVIHVIIIIALKYYY